MDFVKFKICPECGKHNPPSLIECRYCEADLTGVKVVDSAAEETLDNDKRQGAVEKAEKQGASEKAEKQKSIEGMERRKASDKAGRQETAETNRRQETAETELVRICECGVENPPQARKCKACGEDISDIRPVRIEKKDRRSFTYELKSVDGSFFAVIDKPLLIIGREQEFREYLENKLYVSRQQAKLTVVLDKVFIENLSKTNKTFLNNQEIPDGTPTELKNGDEIGLGGKVIEGSRQDLAAYFIFQVKS